MLKFTADGPRGKIYFLGLNRGNIDKLTSGQPISVNLADLGGPPITIGILFGETERILFNSLKAEGLIPKEVAYREAEAGMAEMILVRRESPGPESQGPESQEPEPSGHEPSGHEIPMQD